MVPLDAEGVKRQWKKAGGEGEPPELTPESGGIVFDRGTRGQRENPRLWTPPDPEQDGIPVEMNGKLVRVPRGIDPGWDYVPQLSPEAEEAARKERETAAAETETQTAEQAQQPEPREAQETPTSEPQKPEPEPTPAEDDAGTKRRALLDDLAADLLQALKELKAIAGDKERELRAQNLAPEALDAALKELRERLEEAENEAKQAHEKAVQRALKVEFAEDDDPDGVRQYLAQALGAIVRRLKETSLWGEIPETLEEAVPFDLAIPENEAKWMEKWAAEIAAGTREAPQKPEPDYEIKTEVCYRHEWDEFFKIDPNSGHIAPKFPRKENTIILPNVPCEKDLIAIKQGLGVKTKILEVKRLIRYDKETEKNIETIESKWVEVFIINGRAYAYHPVENDRGERFLTPFPVEGAGFVFTNRGEYKALGCILGVEKKLGYCDVVEANATISQNKITDEKSIRRAWRIYYAIKKGQKK